MERSGIGMPPERGMSRSDRGLESVATKKREAADWLLLFLVAQVSENSNEYLLTNQHYTLLNIVGVQSLELGG